MSSIPLIRLSQVEPFAGAFRASGKCVAPLLQRVGVYPDRLHTDPDALVPEYAVWAFADACAEALGYEAFGFDAGIGAPVERLGAFGREVRSAGTLRGALGLFLEAVTQHSSHARFSLVDGQKALWFCRHGIAAIDVGSWQIEQYVLGLMIRVVRLALGPDWRPQLVLLKERSSRPRPLPRLLREVQVHRGCAVTAIAIPPAALDVRVQSMSGPGATLEPIDVDFAGSLRLALEPMLGAGAASLEDAARLAGASPRTVQRWLERDGRGFASMIEDVRRETALRLIRDPGLRLRDIAERLGYADPANFTRAFRRWTGTSPSQARRRLG